ncbi:hypothetical protein PPERSA_01723 [Pseudocohnilembus persalinus]|uniref:Uncharacterized protein n=1 Tax=Pseudocohnilembus persalinus TaxID=266149 RepID=A0A0V0Q7R9_PSEPJ|nr:hypothetical protein PPERSA_01723 [Pseudocohnilembus persalinus]|eukprot:KRW98285.1 hypothetical protein PPERSA_01723 [Pseudocohnilembus persalinus]
MFVKQDFKANNPWDDDVISDEDEVDQGLKQKIQNQLQASKPYEEEFDKFSTWYNDYFIKATDFEDEKLQLKGRREQQILKINNLSNVQDVSLFDITNTKYTNLNKISQIFTYLQIELEDTQNKFQDVYLGAISMYGERPEDEEDEEIQDGQKENELARILKNLNELFHLFKKLMAFSFNIINQLNFLMNKKEAFYKTFKNIEIYTPLQIIGKIVSMVYTLDQIIINNDVLLSDWNQYKKMLKIVKTEPEKFGVTEKQLKATEKTLIKLERTILSGRCSQGFLSQQWEVPSQYVANNKAYVTIAKNKELNAFFNKYFQHEINRISEKLTSTDETNERQDYLNLLGTYAFYRTLYPNDEDKKLYKQLWQIQRKCPVVITFNHVVCYIYKFLTDVCPISKKCTLDPKDPEGFIGQYLHFIDGEFQDNMSLMYTSFCTWIGRMESNSTSNQDFENLNGASIQQIYNLIMDKYTKRRKLALNGISIASKVKIVITNCLFLHLDQGAEIPNSILDPLRQGIEILQSIKYVFTQSMESFDSTFFSKVIYKKVEPVLRQKLEQLKKEDQQNKKQDYLDVIGAIELVLKIMRHPVNSTHLKVLEFAQQIFLQPKLFQPKEYQDLKSEFSDFVTFNRLLNQVEEATNCSFLYQARDLIPIMVSQTYQNPNIAKRLPLLLMAIQDTTILLKQVAHLPDPNTMYKWFKNHIIDIFYQEYLSKTCESLEDFLRLTIHTMLIQQIENKNPYKEDVKQINKLLNIGKVVIFGSIIDIRSEIQQKLNENFYNINVLNLHDMETYEEMRTLADQQFGLKLIHVYIPSQTIEQGSTKGMLDILSIIRNIPDFIQKYSYNLYNQTFFEITSENKQITSVGISQFSDSIKTHGLGILNTTINFAYKYIQKKISAFSQFLYDDYIQAPLQKEQKWFKEHNESLDGKYPFQRAEKFLKQIKKLGKFEDGTTYIDRFRKLISEVGNALGFIRLVRSASLNYCSQLLEYLPSSINTEDTFTDMARNARFGDTTVQAAQQLDDVFEFITSSFGSRSDYIRIMVQTVQKKINVPENAHLQLFYLLIPALTINFVDTILMAKDRLTKAQPFNAYFSDDGLVMGISYFLKLLKQNELFGSLHWKDEIKSYFTRQKKEIDEISEQQKNVKMTATQQRKAEEVDMHRGLSVRKIQSQIAEFEMFFFSFSSCQVIFRDDPQ